MQTVRCERPLSTMLRMRSSLKPKLKFVGSVHLQTGVGCDAAHLVEVGVRHRVAEVVERHGRSLALDLLDDAPGTGRPTSYALGAKTCFSRVGLPLASACTHAVQRRLQSGEMSTFTIAGFTRFIFSRFSAKSLAEETRFHAFEVL